MAMTTYDEASGMPFTDVLNRYQVLENRGTMSRATATLRARGEWNDDRSLDPDDYRPLTAAGVPTFTHARDLIEMVPHGAIDGAEEIVRAAGHTGAHMHYCHINSTSQRHIDRVLGLVGRAQGAGAQISTEAYPYGSGMTAIGAAFLAPECLTCPNVTSSAAGVMGDLNHQAWAIYSS
jgi:hypothetical protein